MTFYLISYKQGKMYLDVEVSKTKTVFILTALYVLGLRSKRSWIQFLASSLRFQRMVISCFQVAIWLKLYCWKSDVNPDNNQNNQQKSHIFLLFTYGCPCELYYVFLTTFVDEETLTMMRFYHFWSFHISGNSTLAISFKAEEAGLLHCTCVFFATRTLHIKINR